MSNPNVYVPDGFGSCADRSYRYGDRAAHELKSALHKSISEKIALGLVLFAIAITWLGALVLAAGYFGGCRL